MNAFCSSLLPTADNGGLNNDEIWHRNADTFRNHNDLYAEPAPLDKRRFTAEAHAEKRRRCVGKEVEIAALRDELSEAISQRRKNDNPKGDPANRVRTMRLSDDELDILEVGGLRRVRLTDSD